MFLARELVLDSGFARQNASAIVTRLANARLRQDNNSTIALLNSSTKAGAAG
jgi:hypothetical protein